MNRMQRILLLILCLIVFLASAHALPAAAPPAAQAAETCGNVTRWNINLERDMRDIGDVYVWNTDDNQMHIRPVLLYGWHMQASWMEVKTYFGGFPRNADGTFNYGAFSYQRTYNPIVKEDYYALPFRSSWLTGTEMHIALRLDMVKLNSNGQVIDAAIAWGYQKSFGPALYLKHTLQTCRDLSQYDGCQNWWWDNTWNFDHWVNHSPSDSFNQTFQRTVFSPDITLLQALGLTANGVDRMARHATAALLNAENPNVPYAYSIDEIYQMVWRSLETQNYAATANTLYEANSLGCPLQ